MVALFARRDAWLDDAEHRVEVHEVHEGEHLVELGAEASPGAELDIRGMAYGPTYEAALEAALEGVA